MKRDKLQALSNEDLDKDNPGVKKIREFETLDPKGEVREADEALGGGGQHVQSGYKMVAPVIETPVYMPWLLNEVKRHANVTVIKGDTAIPHKKGHKYPLRITDRLAPQEDELRELFGVDAIVNCSALGAAERAGDSMVPLRGALVAVPRSKFANGGPEAAFAMAKTHFQQDMIFIVPREHGARNSLVVGFGSSSGVGMAFR